MILPPGSPPEVSRSVRGFQPGRIDGDQLAALFDQAASAGESNRCIKEVLGAPFFRRRPSA
jgi:hypothetical protein